MNLVRSERTRQQTGPRCIESALAELPTPIRELNRIYIRHVRNRALADAMQAAAWVDRKVSVFLRHDRVRVFAIVSEGLVGMADYVQLSEVRFHVDTTGRSQSISGSGPLPNHRTVHAYLTGRMLSVADQGQLPDAKAWEPVEYRPNDAEHFFRTRGRLPITESNAACLVPGPWKVWCPKLDTSNSGADVPSGAHSP